MVINGGERNFIPVVHPESSAADKAPPIAASSPHLPERGAAVLPKSLRFRAHVQLQNRAASMVCRLPSFQCALFAQLQHPSANCNRSSSLPRRLRSSMLSPLSEGNGCAKYLRS